MDEKNEIPYVGPRSYLEGDMEYFFGRDREASNLLSFAISQPLVLFHAQSGAGKTSLINTRLRPGLEAEGFVLYPTGRVSNVLPKQLEGIENIYVFNLLLHLDHEKHKPQDLLTTSFADYLALWQGETQENSDGKARVLIIDQFEEILTTNQEHWEKRTDFFRQLGESIRNDDLLWVILVMREDFVAGLNPYIHLLPDELRARFHLQRLDYVAAMEAITKPAEKLGVKFDTGVARYLVDNLRKTKISGQSDTYLEEYVETVQLQVVCRRLWEQKVIGEGATLLTRDDIPEGYIEGALTHFYESVINKVSADTGTPVAQLRLWVEDNLITEMDTRGILFKGELETAGLPNSTIKELCAQFLVREEMRAEGLWFELIHDRLVQPIRNSNRKYFVPPVIERFEAHPRLLPLGQKVKLTWLVEKADTVIIEPDNKQVPLEGDIEFSPVENTTYRLRAEREEAEPKTSEPKRVFVVDRGPTATSLDIENPYVGPQAFEQEQGNLFFGREKEAEDLFFLVVDNPLVVVYGPSGAGRSSLLNTRLVPDLTDQSFWVFPVARVSGSLPETEVTPENVFASNLLLRIDRSECSKEDLAQITLGEYFRKQLNEQTDEEKRTSVLIIDQFEEIFTTQLSAWHQREDFFRQLAQLVHDPDLDLKVLLSLREEYFARLDQFAGIFNDGLEARYYVERLDREKALEAIIKPAALAGRPFAPGLAEMLVDDLRRIQTVNPDGSYATALGPYIEPVHLQVVCQNTWENLPPSGFEPITEIDIQEMGDVNRSLWELYERSIHTAVPRAKVKEGDIRYWFQQQLITPQHTRGLVYKGAEQTAGLDNEVVDILEESFLIRTEMRGGVHWIELVHDRLIEPISQSNDAWVRSPRYQAYLWDEEGRPDDKLITGEKLERLEHDPYLELDPLVRDYSEASKRKVELEKKKIFFLTFLFVVILLATTIWFGRDNLLINCLPDCENVGWLLSGVDWSRKKLTGVNLHGANLENANLSLATLTKGNLANANLSGAELFGAYLRWADLSNAVLSDADLRGAELFGADLRWADLGGAELFGADLRSADLDGAYLSGVRYDANTKWPEGFDFVTSGAIGPGADLSGAYLSGAYLRGAELFGADLSGANLSDADLRGADLRGAELVAADLIKANLSESDLRGAELFGAELFGAYLSGAKYDANTKWPDNFDPEAAGAVLAEQE